MFNFRQKLLALAVGCFLAAGVSAQRRDGDKRPPKDPDNRVVVQEKDQKRPQNNEKRGGNKPKDDRKGKP
jgi:hypothetical protein